MKRKIVIGFSVVLLICALGVVGWYFIHRGVGIEQIDQPAWDYPVGDTTPEHLAEVLGSYEYYEELRDSKLLKPIWISPDEQVKGRMEIVYDTHRDQRVYWVAVTMRGEVVKIEGRVITITNEGETISLYVPEFAVIKKFGEKYVKEEGFFPYHEEAKFEDIKVGDWLPHISVVINADQAQARTIDIAVS